MKGCWKDCWPITALKVGRTNCALGSLVLARALTKSGIPEEELEFGSPGPISHATVSHKGLLRGSNKRDCAACERCKNR